MLAAQEATALGAASPLAPVPEYRIDNWTTEEGLPENSVSFITQTLDGYLWVATGDGLARFDGVRFTGFNRGNTPALTRRRFSRLLPDHVGGVWAISEDGALFRWFAGRFRAYTAEDGLPANGCSAMQEDGTGALWVTSAVGARCFTFVRDRFVLAADVSELTRGNIWQLERDASGTLWGLATGELLRVHPGPPQKIEKPRLTNGFPFLLSMKAHPQRGLVLGTENGSIGYSDGRWDSAAAIQFKEGFSIFDPIALLAGETDEATTNAAPPRRLSPLRPAGTRRFRASTAP